ncbi:nucleolar complex protein 2 homolog [Neodiprion lecontei]|uniref:Nucleolar complex protein 2 homolog n=1 Tax=Neodiprion lecontei TaxID=441921 RepID=A0A6J0BP11_NEOLC|nr:nucleolar complex protein 2 homolog [Neodiprion lecontei]
MEHQKSLMKLKDTDPEFYKFLEQNDRNLLNFELSDENEEDDEDGENSYRHVPNANLDIASDESDFEAEDATTTQAVGQPRKVTWQLLKTWQTNIKTDRTSATIKCLTEALHAALLSITRDPETSVNLPYKVEGSAIFNGIVQLCVMELPFALKQFLNLTEDARFEPHRAKKFVKVKNALKYYLRDLISILENVTSSDILTILLKHVHQMLPYFQSFSILIKHLLKILLKFWSTNEESVRVVSFLSILRLATTQKNMQLETLYKTMYVKYVENAKFVSPSTLPGINFTRRSLAEIYLLNTDLSYKHAFLYIRQLAIHLRNATTLKRKESFQTLYNWQFINSLQLWAELISMSKPQSGLRDLLYPVVQIIIGTMKAIPTAQYYPLRFHCISMLIKLSKGTGTFIPVLPFLLEILNSHDFNKRHKQVSMKPVSLTCILRSSKSQMQENGYTDIVMETICELILQNAAKDSHSIAFPDIYVPCIAQLKKFLSICRVANYCRKIKQLLEKLQENATHIEKSRSRIVVNLSDTAQIQNWENNIKAAGTPLTQFYESWIKVHESLKLKTLTQNDEIAEYNLPTLKRSKKQKISIPQEQDESEEDILSNHNHHSTNGDSAKKIKTIATTKSKKLMGHPRFNKNVAVHTVFPSEDTDIVRNMTISDWD